MSYHIIQRRLEDSVKDTLQGFTTNEFDGYHIYEGCDGAEIFTPAIIVICEEADNEYLSKNYQAVITITVAQQLLSVNQDTFSIIGDICFRDSIVDDLAEYSDGCRIELWEMDGNREWIDDSIYYQQWIITV